MKIVRLEAWPVRMALSEPYAITYQKVESTTNIFVRIVTDSPHVGYGCAAPDADVTGETPEQTLTALSDIVAPSFQGEDPLRSALLMERLREPCGKLPSTRAAADMALHDLMGRSAGAPVWKLLGGYRDSIPTSVTIGILPVDQTIDRAKRWLELGFRCLKLKGGADVDEDVERVLKVRQAVGADIELRFDANQGYTGEQAMRFIEQTRPAMLELVEQPTCKSDPKTLGRVTKLAHLPVMADESLFTLVDAFKLARDSLADMVNIKLMKVGGLADALQINAVARASGLEAMVGCMDESALAIAAGLHFALARPNVQYADLDGHIGLVGDPAEGQLRLENGVLYPPEQPGLGIVIH